MTLMSVSLWDILKPGLPRFTWVTNPLLTESFRKLLQQLFSHVLWETWIYFPPRLSGVRGRFTNRNSMTTTNSLWTLSCVLQLYHRAFVTVHVLDVTAWSHFLFCRMECQSKSSMFLEKWIPLFWSLDLIPHSSSSGDRVKIISGVSIKSEPKCRVANWA